MADQTKSIQEQLAEAKASLAKMNSEESSADAQAAAVEEPQEQLPAETAAPNLPGLGNIPGAEGLLAAQQATESGGGGYLFPILTQVTGTSGGMFTKARHVGQDGDSLPEGNRPFRAVYLGYRFLISSWDEEFKEGQKPKKPAFSCAVPANDSATIGRVLAACRKYQFFQGGREKWDGSPGHIRPQMELLMYDPEEDSLFVFQTTLHYNSAASQNNELLQNVQTAGDGSKSLSAFVAELAPKTIKEPTKSGREVVYHYATIKSVVDQKAAECWEKYQAFAQASRNDAALMDLVNQWFSGKDAPLTQAATDALDAAEAM